MFKYFVTSILVIVVAITGITLLYEFVNSSYTSLIVPMLITALAALCFIYLLYRIVDRLVP